MAQDCDNDLVLDVNDWCPCDLGFVTVNTYGCDFPAVCDFIEPADLLPGVASLNSNPGYITRYVLTDSAGLIISTSAAPGFSNINAGKYMVLAIDYQDDGSIANLSGGNALNTVTANCFEWSDALTYRICPQEDCSNGIDDDEDGLTDCADPDCPIPAVNPTYNGVICSGATLNLNETGGDAIFWAWSGPNGFSSSSQNPLITNASTAAAGTYTVTVTGTSGCTATSSINAVVNALPTVGLSLSDTDACETETSISLSGGSPGGGTYGGAHVSGTTFNVTAAGPGTHTVSYTFTDGNGCTNTATDNIIVSPTPTIVNVTVADPTTCGGTGSITVSISGGTGSYRYRVFNGTYTGTYIGGATTRTFNSVAAGTYTVEVQNSNGTCLITYGSAVVLTEPASPQLSFTQNPECGDEGDGSIDLSVSNGQAPYSYVWNTGANTQDLVGIGNGTYSVTVTDANGCSETGSTTVLENSLPTVNLNLPNDEACVSDGIFSLTGGSPVAGIYVGPGVSGTNFDPSVAGVGAHTILYTFVDGNGCSNTATDVINVYAEPSISTVNASSPTTCSGTDGSIEVMASGGTGSLEYRLNSGAWQSSNQFNGLAAGSYNIEVRNDNTYCVIAYGTNPVVLSDPANPVAAISLPATDCVGNAVTFTATNAGAGATYSWDFGANASPSTASGLGPHTVTYSGAGSKTIALDVSRAGCLTSDSRTYTVNALPSVGLVLGDNEACENEANITLSGGSPSGAGGVYSGAHVSGTTFDVASAGPGTHP
ncbi:MAG: SprB repeat-containing protein, partial [Bacteroidota bacterium]